MRILGVEDTGMGAMLLERHLRALGHEAVLARTGAEAIDVLEKDADVDLVVTDLDMPDMDGFQLIDVLRAHEEWRELPVIIATGSIDVATVKRTAALGIPHYLVKPIQRAQLEKMIATVAADRKTVRIAHAEVMSRIGLDDEGYLSIVETFASLIGDLLARIRAGRTLDVTDLRALVEAAPVFGLDSLHSLAVRLLKWGPEDASQDDLVHLKRELLLIRRSLQWRPTGASPASGTPGRGE